MSAACPEGRRLILRAVTTSSSRSGLPASERASSPPMSWSRTWAATSWHSRSASFITSSSIRMSRPPSSRTCSAISESWHILLRTRRALSGSSSEPLKRALTSSRRAGTAPASCAASWPTSALTRWSRASSATVRASSRWCPSSTMLTRLGTTSGACRSMSLRLSTSARRPTTWAASCCSCGLPSSSSCTAAAIPPAVTMDSWKSSLRLNRSSRRVSAVFPASPSARSAWVTAEMHLASTSTGCRSVSRLRISSDMAAASRAGPAPLFTSVRSGGMQPASTQSWLGPSPIWMRSARHHAAPALRSTLSLASIATSAPAISLLPILGCRASALSGSWPCLHGGAAASCHSAAWACSRNLAADRAIMPAISMLCSSSLQRSPTMAAL
mmetsp:Transcript_15247/g.36282  ORF Transcript_15247/g.36282 Transcript_15247/m.36282 type:complete len:385 (+) Transcript_15247:770-1924(+)